MRYLVRLGFGSLHGKRSLLPTLLVLLETSGTLVCLAVNQLFSWRLLVVCLDFWSSSACLASHIRCFFNCLTLMLLVLCSGRIRYHWSRKTVLAPESSVKNRAFWSGNIWPSGFPSYPSISEWRYGKIHELSFISVGYWDSVHVFSFSQ